MALVSTTLIAIVVSYAIWSLQSWFANYRKGRQSGFPVLVCPANTKNVLWAIFSVPFRPVLIRFLPTSVYNRVKPAIYGWEFLYRNEFFDRLGSSFMLVTPGTNELWVADSEIAHSILARRNDFLQLDGARLIFGMFGPNIITADGEDWQRQRKIVAPLLNERISKSVWEESSRQAEEMLESFTGVQSATGKSDSKKRLVGETDFTVPGLRSIAINVLGSVAYGTQKSWQQQSTKKAPPGYQLAYMEAMETVVENLIPAKFVPIRLLTSPIMPKSIQRIGYSADEIPRHLKQVLAAERASERPSQANLLSTLVAISDAESKTTQGTSKSKLFLSESELSGNLFQFTAAGFDTTANTMSYAIALLAIHTEWQDWIGEDIDNVIQSKASQYEEAYPALKRCLALMYEVLRLYTAVAHISRSTKSAQQITTPSGELRHVPADTTVYISGACMNADPARWGSDAHIFRPTRWILSDGSFLKPPCSSFLPWSAGPRGCPGQKMAEVEFVAVMTTIFRSYRVSPAVERGESIAMARERLTGVMADSQPTLTLQMNRPRDLKLRWEERERVA